MAVCVRGMSSRLVASMIAASVMFGANGTLREVFGADSRQVMVKKQKYSARMETRNGVVIG